MRDIDNFVILGGDLRQISVANILAQKGFSVKVYGFEETDAFLPQVYVAKSLESSLIGAQAAILPLPCSLDEETLNLTWKGETIKLFELFNKIEEGTIVLAGRVSHKVYDIASIYNVTLIDYFAREELEILNAIPTAEGALQIAMEETCSTINSSNCLVLGFGRIGKVLSKILSCLGANVTVAARKQQDLAWIKVYGYNAVHINKIDSSIKNSNIIFNTVPSLILGEKQLKLLKQDSLIIDLASKPGGADFELFILTNIDQSALI